MSGLERKLRALKSYATRTMLSTLVAGMGYFASPSKAEAEISSVLEAQEVAEVQQNSSVRLVSAEPADGATLVFGEPFSYRYVVEYSAGSDNSRGYIFPEVNLSSSYGAWLPACEP